MEISTLNIYTVDEAALKLKVSARLVYDLIKSGALKASNVGTSYRLTDEQLRAYLASTEGVILPSTRAGKTAAAESTLNLPVENTEPEQSSAADHSEADSSKPKTRRKRPAKKVTPAPTDSAKETGTADNSMAESTTEGATPEQADSPITTEAEKEGL